jgi:hypothetical protein
VEGPLQGFISENERVIGRAKPRAGVAVKALAASSVSVGLRMNLNTLQQAIRIHLTAWIACLACGAALASTSVPSAPVGAVANPAAVRTAVEPAVWVPREVLVQLHHLPKRYSCEALQRKFRDLLRVLGAQHDVRVLAYGCGADSGAGGYSPAVHLHFEIPRVVQGANLSWADFDANRTNVLPQTIRLRPGSPAAFDGDDCALLRQMKTALFPALSIHVVNYRLACQAPPSAQSRYDLSIAALIPTSAGAARVASRR